MALELVVSKLKKLILVIFGLIKRSLCCFKRRRRSSCDSIPLTGVGIGTPTHYEVQNNDVEWTWEEPVGVVSEPNSIQHHIEMYRQQNLRGYPEKVEEPQPDFFEDMVPKITKQTKLHLRPQNYEDSNASSRLNFAPEALPTMVGPELGSWEESEGQRGSWEDAESWDVSSLVREKRKAERAAMKRDQGRSTLGSKVS
ncbi:receptor-binding cancer antigen expressed on SiSo cells isoform X2 [Homalodisca vitripennis]|nr:receptor-binding cancer antigen expressed on SiSo cells isoform X2 [Homalodisca vitripennis]KAG8337714.1 Receptor-binding cancer antigen [Homalodisca vitripennis]